MPIKSPISWLRLKGNNRTIPSIYFNIILQWNRCHSWEWISTTWAIDNHRPNRFGQPDAEGWFYGISFDRWTRQIEKHLHLSPLNACLSFRLNDAIRCGSASGVASKTSIVRKRRWTRGIRCISPEIMQQIRARTEKIVRLRSHIEQSLKEKERIILALRVYEANRFNKPPLIIPKMTYLYHHFCCRTKIFSQSLHIVTQGTLNTLSIIKEIGSRLRKLRQVEYIYSKMIPKIMMYFDSFFWIERHWRENTPPSWSPSAENVY